MATLKTLREQAHLSQQQLAERAGVGRTTLAKIETNRQRPQPDTLHRLASALGVNPARIHLPATRAPKSAGQQVSQSTDRAQPTPVGSNGLVEQFADGTFRILLDGDMPEDVQRALFGEAVSENERPPKRHILRRANEIRWELGLHVRTLDDQAVRVLGTEAEDWPTLARCTSHGVVLRSVWYGWGQHLSLFLIPWERILCASLLLTHYPSELKKGNEHRDEEQR